MAAGTKVKFLWDGDTEVHGVVVDIDPRISMPKRVKVEYTFVDGVGEFGWMDARALRLADGRAYSLPLATAALAKRSRTPTKKMGSECETREPCFKCRRTTHPDDCSEVVLQCDGFGRSDCPNDTHLSCVPPGREGGDGEISRATPKPYSREPDPCPLQVRGPRRRPDGRLVLHAVRAKTAQKTRA